MTVPRVQKVIMIEAPEPPAPKRRKRPTSSALLEEKREALHKVPTQFVVDSFYDGGGDLKKAEKAARTAAYQVNLGERQEWPGNVYYGIYRLSPEGDAYQLAVGLREYMDPGWAEFVSRAGSRKKKSGEYDGPEPLETRSGADVCDDGDEDEDFGDHEEYENS